MYDNRLVAGKLNRWGRFMRQFSLPEYDEIPNLGLYMDQVLTLMNQYLAPLSAVGSDENMLTAATINNYVRMKVMPAPLKKKYYRSHVAYLLIICSLKQTMSIADIQRIMPYDLHEEEVRAMYEDYSEVFKSTVKFFVNQVKSEAENLLNDGSTILLADPIDVINNTVAMPEQENFDKDVRSLILGMTTIANFSKLLTAKLIALGGAEFTPEAVQDRKV